MKINFIQFLLFTFFTTNLWAQSEMDDVQYWVGAGSDSAVFVVDFNDDLSYISYSWGYLFNEGEDVDISSMISAISADENTLDIASNDIGITDITYNEHGGIIGSPNFWNLYSKTEGTDYQSIENIGFLLTNGDIIGYSYHAEDTLDVPSPPMPALGSAWFASEEVAYWVGTGAKQAILVLDFISPGTYGAPNRFAWGYQFDGDPTAEQMLSDIANDDPNLNVVMENGFLNDITYIEHAGLAGDPNYWSTHSGTNLSNWQLNDGISTTLEDGDWFGCSYDENWPPMYPQLPIPAVDPSTFAFETINTWVGTGTDSCVVVIDFNDGTQTESYAFGYLFEGTTTGEQALLDLADELDGLSVLIGGGFLSDIHYFFQSGIGGAPDYWGTWSAQIAGGWYLNDGLSAVINNGEWFGCGYTNWNPPLPPSIPTSPIISVEELEQVSSSLYPNPVLQDLAIDNQDGFELLTVIDLSGKKVMTKSLKWGEVSIDMSALPAGVYNAQLSNNQFQFNKLIIKQ